jgi:hypothetical protein
MSMDYGEKGFFSASWDGEAVVSEFELPPLVTSVGLI